MPPSHQSVSLRDFLILLAQAIPNQQARLDLDYLKRLEAFMPVLQQARAAGYETLARALTPTAIVLNNTELQLQLQLTHTVEQQVQLQVQLLDLGFMRRYAASATVRHALSLRVERIPWALHPGHKPESPI
ncbi:MAG: hypothetical protein ACJ74W_02510 [Pyrinomonadaceae bacterium]